MTILNVNTEYAPNTGRCNHRNNPEYGRICIYQSRDFDCHCKNRCQICDDCPLSKDDDHLRHIIEVRDLLNKSIESAEKALKKYPNEKALMFSMKANTNTRDNITKEIEDMKIECPFGRGKLPDTK